MAKHHASNLVALIKAALTITIPTLKKLQQGAAADSGILEALTSRNLDDGLNTERRGVLFLLTRIGEAAKYFNPANQEKLGQVEMAKCEEIYTHLQGQFLGNLRNEIIHHLSYESSILRTLKRDPVELLKNSLMYLIKDKNYLENLFASSKKDLNSIIVLLESLNGVVIDIDFECNYKPSSSASHVDVFRDLLSSFGMLKLISFKYELDDATNLFHKINRPPEQLNISGAAKKAPLKGAPPIDINYAALPKEQMAFINCIGNICNMLKDQDIFTTNRDVIGISSIAQISDSSNRFLDRTSGLITRIDHGLANTLVDIYAGCHSFFQSHQQDLIAITNYLQMRETQAQLLAAMLNEPILKILPANQSPPSLSTKAGSLVAVNKDPNDPQVSLASQIGFLAKPQAAISVHPEAASQLDDKTLRNKPAPPSPKKTL